MTRSGSPSPSAVLPAIVPAARRRGTGFRPAGGFLVLGLGSLALLLAAFWWQPLWLTGSMESGPWVSLWHAASVGVVAPLLFGSAYHLLPLLAGVPLWSTRLPWLHLGLHTAGVVWLAAGAMGATWAAGGVGGWLVFAGVLAFAFNQQLTVNRLSLWDPANITLSTALFWMVVAGGLVAVPGVERLLPLSVGEPGALTALQCLVVLYGVVLPAMLAAALKGVTMFLVTPARGRALTWVGWLALNAGVLLLVAGESSQLALLREPAAWLVAGGTGAYLFAFLGAGWGGWRRAGWDLALVVIGVLMLAPLFWIGLRGLPIPSAEAGAWLREQAVGLLAGPVLLAGVGLCARTIPLLVWQVRFAGRAGREAVPALGSLSNRAALPPLVVALLLGWGYLVAGLLIGEATGILFAAACYLAALILLAVHVYPALRTLFHPDLMRVKAGERPL